MSLGLMEAAISACKTYLSAGMAAKLTALNTAYADSVTLANIKTWYTAEVSAVPEYPAAFILAESSVVQGEGNGWVKSAHAMTIAFLVGDANAEQLRTRLYRYIRATIELLIEARSSGGWAYVIEFDTISFSPMFTRAGEFLGDARLIASLGRTETK